MREITYHEAITEAIDQEMARDSRVIVMGEDVGPQGGVFGTSRGLYDKYGQERVLDTPISENSFVGCAIGASMTGLRPIVEVMYIDFITLAMDQIINQAAKARYMFGGRVDVPVVIRTQGGAGKGNAGHHSQSLEVFFCHIPGLKVIMPSTPYDAKGLLKSAIRDNNAVVFIEHKLLYNTKGEVPKKDYTIDLGKAEIKRKGSDITIVAVSYMVLKAMEAAKELEKEGISCEIIDPGTLSPLDKDTIVSSVKKTGNIIIVHESAVNAGTGAYISQVIGEDVFDWLDGPVTILGGLNCPIPYSSKLEEAVIPSAGSIKEKVKKLLNNPKGENK